MKREVVIASACRTPIGALLGGLSGLTAGQLGAAALAGAIRRAGVRPEQVEEVLMGCVLQGGAGQNVARQAAVGAGIPIETTAVTVNMVCGSGLKAVVQAAQSILCGDREIVAAGGTESMSGAPYYCKALRAGSRLGDVTMLDAVVADGLTDVFHNIHMGLTAENVAEKYGITREEQDAFAAESQRRAGEAIAAGRFEVEIEPVEITDRKGNVTVVSKDEHPRPGTTADKLAKLRPAFKKDGTVTAGNASGINDGAAALILMSSEKASELGIKPLARLVSWGEAGVDPKFMGIGPVPAVKKALAKANMAVEDLELVEANEAFAVQSLAVQRELGLDAERTNVNGGAIALGHPIGASGARILVTLLHEMARRDAAKGAATLCIGGGMGICVIAERGE
jgi:acetyl-CoA C-acetyltransferase